MGSKAHTVHFDKTEQNSLFLFPSVNHNKNYRKFYKKFEIGWSFLNNKNPKNMFTLIKLIQNNCYEMTFHFIAGSQKLVVSEEEIFILERFFISKMFKTIKQIKF